VASLPWRLAWVTGASSGIGRAMTLQMARAGVTVAATARSVDTLEALAREAPGIHAFPGDVGDAEVMAQLVSDIEARHGAIDLAILNAGVWHPIEADQLAVPPLAQSMHVNYLGVVHGLVPLTSRMLERGQGRIAIVGSVAGYRGLPKAAAYGPTKAALINLAESLKPTLERRGVNISIINPGFVETPMTSLNKFPMPFLVSAEDAAQRIIRGLTRGQYEIAFPWPMRAMMKVLRVLPNWLFFRVTRRM
jgi:short-subunit dehydrogenase